MHAALVGLGASTLYMVALRDGKLSLVSPTVATSGGIGALGITELAIFGELPSLLVSPEPVNGRRAAF